MWPSLWLLSSVTPTPSLQLWPWFHLQVETEYSFLDYVMGGCQINFTVSCFIRGRSTDPGHKVAFSSPPLLLPGGCGLHGLQWRPFLTWFPALPEPNRGQWVPDSTVECGQCGSGLWFVSNFVSCPSPLPADALASGLMVLSLLLPPFTVFPQGQAVPSIWIWGPGTPWLAGECFFPLPYSCF